MRPYNHITYEERRVIQKLLYSRTAKTEICELLQRDESTIYRELKRNKTYGYHYKDAHEKACKRKNKKKRKPDKNGILRLIICTLLIEKNSPEVISYYLKQMFPDEPSMHLSHESIYQWIYEQRDENGAFLLTQYLFTKRKRRQIRSNIYKSRKADIRKCSIHDRPQAANEKTEYGHLEGDLIESTGKDAYMLTLVDRKYKYVWGLPLFSKDSETVSRAVIEALSDLPDSYVRTITFDNGTEFSAYKNIEESLQCKVYFADPYCSWQRGLVEHINSRIRQYLPKKKSFSYLTDEILYAINSRPRKSIGWQTPIELLENTIAFET